VTNWNTTRNRYTFRVAADLRRKSDFETLAMIYPHDLIKIYMTLK